MLTWSGVLSCMGITDCGGNEFAIPKTTITADTIVAYLNDCLSRDPNAVTRMFAHYVPANQDLAGNTRIVFSGKGDSWTFGVLGLINGLLAQRGERIGLVESESVVSSDVPYVSWSPTVLNFFKLDDEFCLKNWNCSLSSLINPE